MKHTKRILAALLALVLLLTPMVSVSVAKTDAQTDTIVYFDLEAFLAELPTSQIQYDYYKLATALQGLANREKPQLFFHMMDNDISNTLGYDIDSFWFEKITDPELGYGELADGGDLSNYKVDKVGSIWMLLDRFSDCYNGLVLWDEDVPSTANVASTIAGCENLLPVRYSTGAFDLYTALMGKGFKKDDIKRDLTGLFTGEGFIPTLGSSVPGAKIEYTTTPSTKTQKTDPYIWAKMFYLDTGLTHPLHMTYSIDARTNRKADWSKQDGGAGVTPALAGELISAYIPSVMGLGEVRPISLTYQNTGTETWTEGTYDRFAINLIDGPFRLANKDDGSNSDSGDGNRLKLTTDVYPGDTYTVTGWLVAPRVAGEYMFRMFMNREQHGNISTNFTVNITVKKGGELSEEDLYIPYAPLEIAEQEVVAKNAAIIKAGIDATVAPNASGTAQVVVKNTGTEAWPAGSTYALQYKVGSGAAATISLPTAVDPGQSVSFNVPYKAPASGTFDIALQMISGGENVGEDYTCTVNVEDTTSASNLAAEIVSVSSPKSLTAGAKAEVVVEVLNSGSTAWTDAVKLVDASSKGYMSAEGVDDDDDALINEIALESGVTVEPGDTYRFHFDLHSYTNNGTKKSYLEPKQLARVELQVKSGSTVISDTHEVPYEIIDVCDTPVTVFAKTSDYKLTTYEYNARFISAAMPTTMNVGELVPVQFTLMNIGTATWESIKAGRSYMRMAFRGAQNGFGFVTDPVAGTGDVRDLNRIDITNGVSVAPGDTYTYTAYLKAPAEAGIYDVRLDGLRDTPTTWGTADKTFTVTVVDPANPIALNVLELDEEPLLAVSETGTIKTNLPTSSEPYTEVSATATAKNATSSAWAVPAGVTAPVETATVNGVYLKYSYRNPFNPTATNKKNPFVLYAPLSAAAAAGANATFAVKFTAPVVEGTFDLKSQVVSISGGTETVLVPEVTEQYVVASATPAATPVGTTAATNKSTTYKMEFVSAKVPATMKAGESAFISISYKNTGAAMAIMSTSNPTQGNRATIGLCAQSGTGGFKLLDYGFTFASGGEKHDDWALKYTKENQLHLREGQPARNFDANETEVFTGVMTAPTTPGTYTLSFAGFSGTETYASDMTNFTVTVVDPNAGSADENNIIFHETADVTTEPYKATIMSAVLPETVKPGEKIAVSFTVKNTGTTTFKSHLNAPNQNESLRIGFITQNVVGYYKANDTLDANGYMAKKFSVLCDSTTRTLNGSPWEGAANGEYSRMDMLNGKTVASGDTYTFTGHLVTPTTPGTYEFEIVALADVAGAGSKSWWSTKEKITIKVVDPNAEPEVENNIIFRESADVTTEPYKAAIMSASVPLQVDPGEKFDVSFTVKNIGTEAFKSALNVAATTADDCLRLAFLGSATQFNSASIPSLQPTSVLDANGRMKDKFFILCNSTTRKLYESPWEGAANGQYNRMDIKSQQTIASGELYNFTGSFVAPTTEGVYKIPVIALREGGSAGYRSERVELEITVGEPPVENNVIFRESADVTTEPYKAAIMGAKLPLQVDPGEKFDVSFTVKNIGTETFKSKLNVAATTEEDCLRLAFLGAATQFNSANKPTLQPTSILDANGRMKDKFFILCNSTTAKANESPWAGAANGEYNRMDIKNQQTIASGELYNFTGSFVAPTTEGVYKIQVRALREGGSAGYRSDPVELVITVGEPNAFTPEEPTYTTLARDADIMLATMPEVYSNETGEMKFVVKNTGTEAWTQTAEGEEGFYLRLSIGSEKIYVPASKNVAPGETVQFVCDYTAPDREATRSVTAQMVYRNSNATSKFFGEKVTDEIIVELDTGARAAKILSVQYSESLRESTKGTLMVEVLNTGALTWGGNNKIVLSELDGKTYLSAPGAADDNVASSEIGIEPGVQVKPGERYVFVADLHSWTMFKNQRDYVMPNTNLELTLQLDAISGESTGKFGDEITTSTKITTVMVKPDVVIDEDPDNYPVTNEIQKAVLVYAEMPTKMAPGQVVPVKLTFKNIGQTEWYATDPMTTLNCVRLRCDTYGAFDMCSDIEGTAGWTANRDRVNMADSTKNDHVMPGETYTYGFYLKAPTTPGQYSFWAYLINDSVKGQGGFEETTYGVSFPIQVGTQSAMEEVEFATSKATYDSLMLTAVGNADYYIMHKAFFWDLAMDETIAPLDDRSQPVGTDVKVLRQLLDSQRKRAQAYEEGKDPWNKVPGVGEGYGIFQVGGFLPWYMKYCSESDTMSKFTAAQQEWQQMMHISEYGGGSDADAYGTVTISNCSVYAKLKNNVPKFSKNVTQAQPDFDPAVGDPTVKYDPEKTYILWHMGDWDGSAWTANILPALWENDPRRGEIPVGWAIAAGNSLRIPHVFNWQYDNATPNDYFIAGDNGINYYDPNMNSRPHTEITGITKEMGLEILDDFVAYNQYFNDIFSIDITGLLHTAGSGPSDDIVREAFHKISPYGVGVTQEGANAKMKDCGIFVGADGKATPFIPSYVFTSTSDGTLKATVENLGTSLASKIKSGPQFQVLRTVKVKVTSLIEIMEAMEAANPGIDQMYEVVDPYTFMRLAKESNGGFIARSAATYDISRAGTVKIDGTMAQGEWTAAKQMLVSPTSAEIAKSGNNWNVTTLATDADLTSKFRVMWDNNYLYVSENRTDNGHISTAKTDGIDWTADTGALYISTDGDKVGSSYFKGDNAVIFNIGDDGKPNVWIRQGGDGGVKTERKMNEGEYIAAFTMGEGGNYVYEVAIPWSVLGTFRPAYGKTVGLAVLAIDGDVGLIGGGRQIMWGGAGDNQSTWADATFK